MSDWEKEFYEDPNLWASKDCEYGVGCEHYELVEDKVKDFIAKQRTQILDEIIERVKEEENEGLVYVNFLINLIEGMKNEKT